ncbi:hypothetical protein DSO57_1003602 [Entomophthora muscae]|uniref:Uncharacterized protein n=1 Tax=Entomophthora muscae TaxID=34485 RepID=A0ACC2TVV5_9FUNG|nr:hypothetical protein DSO57_1003602 [Entomophthora muscae]
MLLIVDWLEENLKDEFSSTQSKSDPGSNFSVETEESEANSGFKEEGVSETIKGAIISASLNADKLLSRMLTKAFMTRTYRIELSNKKMQEEGPSKFWPILIWN